MDNPVLVDVARGPLVESCHRGALCVADADGTVLLSLGDVERPVFPRSAVKAIQALPLVAGGAADRLGLTDAEIALAISSHSGEPAHVETADAMLAKAGCDPSCLACGGHWPMDQAAARALEARGGTPTRLHDNCSGKHAGFLCLACGLDAPREGYERADHPVQGLVRAALEDVTGACHTPDVMAVDGCSIPTYAVPLPSLAYGFARFGTGAGLPPETGRAAARIRRAAAAHPFMVAGTGRFDTRLMERLRERAFVKTGAEGVYCAALPEVGLGVALKCDDGATRAAEAILASLVLRFLPLADADRAFVEALARPAIRDRNDRVVGEIRPSEALATMR